MTARPPRKSLTPQYRDAYCTRVIDVMGQGYSLTAFAGEIGASRADLERWCAKHSRFAQAVERGQARRARVLEDRLLAARGGGAFGAHMEALKTAAPQEWSANGYACKPPPRAADEALGGGVDLPNNGRE
jgi:hypothetical protein